MLFGKGAEGKYVVKGEGREYVEVRACFERLYLGRDEVCEDVWQE